MLSGSYVEDIRAQPDTLRQVVNFYEGSEGCAVLDEAAKVLNTDAIGTGMGASLFALHATREHLLRGPTRVSVEETASLAESDSWQQLGARSLLLVSQSGETVEAKVLLDRLAGRYPVVLVTRDPLSTLARKASVVLPLMADEDVSVAIKTYTASLAVLYLLGATLAGTARSPLCEELRDAADKLEVALEIADEFARRTVNDFAGVAALYAVGRGEALGSALGTALLIKETAKFPCEGMSSAQFRHGAIEVVSNKVGVLIFGSSDPMLHRLDENLIGELARYGARVALVCSRAFPKETLEALRCELPAAGPVVDAILQILPLQYLAFRFAEARGIVPGSFRNTVPVIKTA